MTVLVTGGAGFIGRHLLDRLSEAGVPAVCLDNFCDNYSPALKGVFMGVPLRVGRENDRAALASGKAELAEGDIRDLEFCRSVFEKYRPEKVVHLAALAGVLPSLTHPLLYEEVNCKGTLNLLECAREFGVQRFVFSSSASVYGLNRKLPFSEDDPVEQPMSPYAATKRAAELYCYTYHQLYGISVAALRFFTVYGPRQRPSLAIHKFTANILRGEPIPLYGDGSSLRDYTYYSDVVDGIMAALDAELGFEIINLGNCNPVRLSDLVSIIEQATGKQARIDRLPNQPGDVPAAYADISKARRLLGYEPKMPIERGIANFVGWCKRNPADA